MTAATDLEARDAPRQLGFDEADRARGERLGETIDKLAAKYGKGAIRRAVHLDDDWSGSSEARRGTPEACRGGSAKRETDGRE